MPVPFLPGYQLAHSDTTTSIPARPEPGSWPPIGFDYSPDTARSCGHENGCGHHPARTSGSGSGALNHNDVYLMTVTDVRGCGRQRGFTEVYRAAEFQLRLLPNETGNRRERCLPGSDRGSHRACRHTPGTGQVGDGKIFVLSLEDCIRIRTGERGGQAIGP